jgi:hypothetical protein
LDDDVRRRAFLGLGLAVVVLGPDAAAHDEALRANDGLWRCSAQIELHRAVGETDAGHALHAFTNLSEVQRSDQFIRRLAARVLASCETRAGAGAAGVAELREALRVA